MACQIVHDSLHERPGWVEWFLLASNQAPAGYGAVVVSGPWRGTRTVFEFYVMPPARSQLSDLFAALVASSRATAVVAQTNDPLLAAVLPQWCPDAATEKIVFRDAGPTALAAPGAVLRPTAAVDRSAIFPHQREPAGDWALMVGAQVVATGGILRHDNPPYGDIYMEVREDLRRRGYGSYLVQELKRVAHESGVIPCARCDPDNLASRRTLERAGLAPCARLVAGKLRAP